MSLEICGRCHGEGECITERDGWRICPECGGDGYIDEYQEDEWHEDDDEEWDEWEWHPELYKLPLLTRVKLWFRDLWWRISLKFDPLQFDDDDDDYIPF